MADEQQVQNLPPEPETKVENHEEMAEMAAIEQGLTKAEQETAPEKKMAVDQPKQQDKKAPTPKDELEPFEGKPTDKPEAQITPQKSPSDDDFDKTLNEIQPKKGSHPNVEKGIKVLKDIAKEERTARKRLETEFEKTKEELKNARLVTPELEQELEELRLLRKSEAIDKDPEYQQKFVAPITERKDKITKLLRDNGASDKLLEFIESNGGLAAMAVSTNKHGDLTMAEWVEKNVIPKIPSTIQRTMLERLISDTIDLQEAAQKESEKAKAEAPERAKKRQEEVAKKFNEAAEAARSELGQEAKKWEVPQDATEEQRKAIELHNQRLDKAQQAFNQFIKDGNNPEKVARMMVAASHSAYLLEVNQELQAQTKKQQEEIDRLNERLTKVKGSGSHARRSNAPPPKPAKDQPSSKLMSSEQAFDNFMKETDQ